MSKSNRAFPEWIHVTYNDDGDGFFEAHENGVTCLDEPDQPVAIYQLVRQGKVDIAKTFIETGLRRKSKQR